MEKHTISEPALDNEEGKAMEDKHDSLREFIASECKEQLQKHGNDDSVSAERMDQFFQRAISESERMNAEVSKCHAKQQKLYDELGKHMFESWSKDHASEVLTTEQYQSWLNHEKEHTRVLQEKQNFEKSSKDDSCR